MIQDPNCLTLSEDETASNSDSDMGDEDLELHALGDLWKWRTGDRIIHLDHDPSSLEEEIEESKQETLSEGLQAQANVNYLPSQADWFAEMQTAAREDTIPTAKASYSRSTSGVEFATPSDNDGFVHSETFHERLKENVPHHIPPPECATYPWPSMGDMGA
ncbi:hypothetical protein C8Q75DRAFT_730149 [Abortiporus biennis]|nr:hypothetical protein C8Q75DRAFT_730149 [Abortiporus biennis]